MVCRLNEIQYSYVYLIMCICTYTPTSSLRPEHVGDASNASLRHSFDTQLPGGANTSSKGGGSDSGTSRAGGRGDRPSYKHRSTDQTAPPTSTYTTVHSASSPVAFTLHVLMAGGVFRWLQIGCNDDFGRKVEVIFSIAVVLVDNTNTNSLRSLCLFISLYLK
jgi:hypothetical protein